MQNTSLFLAPDFNKRATVAVLAVCLCLLVYAALSFAAPNSVVPEKSLTDFDIFYLVGDMIWRGEFLLAYHFEDFTKEIVSFYGDKSFMPWTYPPQFGVFMAPFARLPIGWAHLLFTGLSFVAYLKVVHTFSRQYFGVALFILFPTLALNLKSGQNGFLTASLIGWFIWAYMKNSRIAGLPLGLMIIKPHLAAIIGIVTLLSRRVPVILIALFIVLLSTLGVTLLFGVEVWTHFLGGVREASLFLKSGLYPLFRMTSLYATCLLFNVPAPIALGIQIMTAVAMCGTAIYGYFKWTNQRYFLAFVTMASVWISPYSYDYDLAIWGLGIALLVPDLVKKANQNELLILGLSCWVALGSGIFQAFIDQAMNFAQQQELGEITYPIASFALIVTQGYVVFILRRKHSAVLTAEAL